MLCFGLKCIACYLIVLYGIALHFVVSYCTFCYFAWYCLINNVSYGILWYPIPLHGIACYCIVENDQKDEFEIFCGKYVGQILCCRVQNPSNLRLRKNFYSPDLQHRLRGKCTQTKEIHRINNIDCRENAHKKGKLTGSTT